MKSLNCRKVGLVLAVAFLVGIAASTIYSRGYAERQKPLVHVVASESRSMVWAWETRGTVEAADPAFREAGWEWTVDITVPEEAYSFHMGELMLFQGFPVSFILDGRGWPFDGVIVQRQDEGRDVHLTIGLTVVTPPTVGEGARVLLEILREESSLADLVPATALHHDPFLNEHYIYFVNRRDSTWGREFVVVRQAVQFGLPSSVGGMYNIYGHGADFRYPVIVWSDQDLYDGAVVRLFD